MYTEMDMYSIWMFVSICWRTTSPCRESSKICCGFSLRNLISQGSGRPQVDAGHSAKLPEVVWPNKATAVSIWLWVKTLVPLVNIKIAGKWMFIPLKMVSIGIDPYPYHCIVNSLPTWPPRKSRNSSFACSQHRTGHMLQQRHLETNFREALLWMCLYFIFYHFF